MRRGRTILQGRPPAMPRRRPAAEEATTPARASRRRRAPPRPASRRARPASPSSRCPPCTRSGRARSRMSPSRKDESGHKLCALGKPNFSTFSFFFFHSSNLRSLPVSFTNSFDEDLRHRLLIFTKKLRERLAALNDDIVEIDLMTLTSRRIYCLLIKVNLNV